MVGKSFESSNSAATDGSQEPLRTVTSEELLSTFEKAGKPLHWLEIERRAGGDGSGIAYLKTTKLVLEEMLDANIIFQSKPGTYTLDRTIERHDESSDILKDRIIALLGAGQSLHYQRINKLLEEEYQRIFNEKDTFLELEELAKEGLVNREKRKNFYRLPGLAGIEHEPFPTITEEIITVLLKAGQPLHHKTVYQEICNDGNEQILPENISNLLNALAHKGTITRVARGIFSLPEFVDQEALKIMSTRNRILQTLKQAGQPLHHKTVYQEICNDGNEQILPENISNLLNALAHKGTITRVARGIFSLPEFVDQEALKIMSTRNRILQTLKQAGRPVNLKQINRRLKSDNPFMPKPSYDAVCQNLVALTDGGVVVRVKHGIYSLSEFAERRYDVPGRRKVVIAMNKIAKTIKQAGKPLHLREISQLLAEEEGNGYIEANISYLLRLMIKEEKLVKLRQGWYALPEFAEKWRDAFLSTEDRIIRVLKQAGQPLHHKTVYQEICNDGNEQILPKNISNPLNALAHKGTITRVERGIFSLPEFVDQDYAAPKRTPARSQNQRYEEQWVSEPIVKTPEPKRLKRWWKSSTHKY